MLKLNLKNKSNAARAKVSSMTKRPIVAITDRIYTQERCMKFVEKTAEKDLTKTK